MGDLGLEGELGFFVEKLVLHLHLALTRLFGQVELLSFQERQGAVATLTGHSRRRLAYFGLECQFSLLLGLLLLHHLLNVLPPLFLLGLDLADPFVDGHPVSGDQFARVRVDAGLGLGRRQLSQHVFHPQFLQLHLLAASIFEETIDGPVQLHL